MKYSTVMAHLAKEYEHAVTDRTVRKPICYALYRTWKWCDAYEKPRNEKQEEVEEDG